MPQFNVSLGGHLTKLSVLFLSNSPELHSAIQLYERILIGWKETEYGSGTTLNNLFQGYENYMKPHYLPTLPN